MADEEMLSGPALQAQKVKDTEEERAFYRDQTAMYDISSMKTAFNGYDRKAVRDYVTKLLEQQTEQEKSAGKVIDELRSQIASLKRDKEESIAKYNKLLLAKLSTNDASGSDGSDADAARFRKESEELQKKVLMLSGQLSVAKTEKTRAQKQIDDLTEQLQELRAENERMATENIDSSTFSDAKQVFQQKIKELSDQIKKLKAQKQSAQDSMQKAEKERDDAQKELEVLRPKCESLKKDLDEANGKLEDIDAKNKEQVDALQQQVQDLTGENKKLREMTEYTEDIKKALVRSTAAEKEASAARSALEGKVRALGMKSDAMEKENEQLRISVGSLQSAIDESRIYNEKIEQELHNLYAAQLGEAAQPEEQQEEKAAETAEQAETDMNEAVGA